MIVSHSKLVGACTRSNQTAEKQQEDENCLSSLETQTTRRSHGSGNSECNLKGLERRYHLLYLKAIEVQCLLESLLGRKIETQVNYIQMKYKYVLNLSYYKFLMRSIVKQLLRNQN